MQKLVTCPDKLHIKNIKNNIINTALTAKVLHITSSFSSIEILYTLYAKITNITPANSHKIERDRVVISKEHCRLAQIFVLSELGLLSDKIAKTFNQSGSKVGHDIFKEIGNDDISAVDIAFGSLGQGLGIGIGLALANPNNNIYVIVGDGELQEGSCWEALMYIGHNKIKNITIVIDRNYMQIAGYTKDIIDTSSCIKEQIEKFHFETFECNGHDVNDLERVFKIQTRRPKCIIANTIKGKEARFILENNSFTYFHSGNFSKEEFKKIQQEISHE